MTCPAQTGPVWKTGGEAHGCGLPELPPHATHECPCGAWWDDSIRRNSGHAERPGPAH